MEDKELAEKVAKKLGWVCYSNGKDYNGGDFYVLDPDEQIHYIGDNGDFFSWPTFGLMVEKAEAMGWNLKVEPSGFICFLIKEQVEGGKYLVHGKIDELVKGEHIRNCALAFIEIPDK